MTKLMVAFHKFLNTILYREVCFSARPQNSTYLEQTHPQTAHCTPNTDASRHDSTNSINISKPNQHKLPTSVAMATSNCVHRIIISGYRTGACSNNTRQTTLSAEIATRSTKTTTRRRHAIVCQSTVYRKGI